MSIKFFCSCGKKLKARDEMASRRSVCPKCGSPVGIPSLQPTRKGGLAPLTPLERLKLAKNRKPEQVPLPLGEYEPPVRVPTEIPNPNLVHFLANAGAPHPKLEGRFLEENWLECLRYPIRAWRLCLMLSLLLAIFSGAVALLLPPMLAEMPTNPWVLTTYYGTCLLILLLFVGLPCSFLDLVLISALRGEVYYIRWSGNAFQTILFSGAKWVTCFVAGPILFAGMGVLYWTYCGELGWIDWLILIELALVCFTYWMFAVLSLSQYNWIGDLNPFAIADLAHRLGGLALAWVLGAALLFFAHVLLVVEGVAELHDTPLQGWVLLVVACASGTFCGTFLCRLLGIWCFRTRRKELEFDDEEDED